MFSNVKHPALRYFGGKFRLAARIIPMLPRHLCYVEPFGGAMGVLLRKQPSKFEVYNDLDGEVVNFFRQLREHPDDLIRAIELTPYSREEQILAFESTGDLSELERARRLYVRCWQSHGGGRTQWKSGWRYQINDNRGKAITSDWNNVARLWQIVLRLKNVQIENDDAIHVLQRFDGEDTLFYIDPPYLASTRSIRWRTKAYTYEIDDDYHRRLADTIWNLKGMAVISGKPSPLYEDLFQGWKKIQYTVPTDFNSMTDECIWFSPNTENNHRQIKIEF